MDAERWQAIKRLFGEATERPAAEREAFLVAATNGDETLLAEVLELLRQDQCEDSMIRQAMAAGIDGLVREQPPLKTGDRIGHYRIIEAIGEGGMGAIYLAERTDTDYQQQVAIKLIHAAHVSHATLQRFHAERQILARLKHPNIAYLLDGGRTDSGLPFLVMEHVDGETITDHCRIHRLDLPARLALFSQVCEAVAYAHRNLVVHRDIKLANILVTRDGQVKLLDFGIAKMLDPGPSLPGDRTSTRSEMRLLTPEYASPEQVQGQPVTTQTDVYALGNLLFQLLTERKLFDGSTLDQRSLEHMICEQPPIRPSDAMDTHLSLAGDGPQREQRRRVRLIRRQIRGDLDTIVLTALQKPPERRYPSVEKLIGDIRRHRLNFPLEARPDSWRYRSAKFLQRNRLPAALAGLLIVSLAVFLITGWRQSAEIERQRQAALLQADTAQRISEFMIGIFDAADPNTSAGKNITARELLANGEQKIAELEGKPLLQAAMQQAIGRVYLKLSDIERAQTLIDQAGQRIEAQASAPDRLRIGQLAIRADLQFELGQYAESENSYRRTLALLESQQPRDLKEIINSELGLAAVLSEQQKDREALLYERRILQHQIRLNGADSAEAAEAMTFLGMSLRRVQRYRESERYLRQALDLKRAVWGNRHLETAHTLNHLARTLTFTGAYDEALAFAREGLEIRRAIHQGPNVEVSASLGNVAHILTAAERYPEAIAVRQESIALLKQLFGDDHPYVAGSYGSLAGLYLKKGDPDKAAIGFRKSIELFERLSSDPGIKLASPLSGLGQSLIELGRPREALPHLQRSLKLRRRLLEPDHWRIALSLKLLGQARLDLEEYAQAETDLLEAWTMLDTLPEGTADLKEQTRVLLIRLYLATDRPQQAKRYRP